MISIYPSIYHHPFGSWDIKVSVLVIWLVFLPPFLPEIAALSWRYGQTTTREADGDDRPHICLPTFMLTGFSGVMERLWKGNFQWQTLCIIQSIYYSGCVLMHSLNNASIIYVQVTFLCGVDVPEEIRLFPYFPPDPSTEVKLSPIEGYKRLLSISRPLSKRIIIKIKCALTPSPPERFPFYSLFFFVFIEKSKGTCSPWLKCAACSGWDVSCNSNH